MITGDQSVQQRILDYIEYALFIDDMVKLTIPYQQVNQECFWSRRLLGYLLV